MPSRVFKNALWIMTIVFCQAFKKEWVMIAVSLLKSLIVAPM